MNSRLKQLLIDFKVKKELLAGLLADYSNDKPFRERFGNVEFGSVKIEYLFHGTGCQINYNNQELNFEILFENDILGRIDGFSLFDVKKYCKSIHEEELFKLFKESHEDLLRDGDLIISTERKNIFFLKEDYSFHNPFIFEHKWDQDWYLENGT